MEGGSKERVEVIKAEQKKLENVLLTSRMLRREQIFFQIFRLKCKRSSQQKGRAEKQNTEPEFPT